MVMGSLLPFFPFYLTLLIQKMLFNPFHLLCHIPVFRKPPATKANVKKNYVKKKKRLNPALFRRTQRPFPRQLRRPRDPIGPCLTSLDLDGRGQRAWREFSFFLLRLLSVFFFHIRNVMMEIGGDCECKCSFDVDVMSFSPFLSFSLLIDIKT